MTSSCSAVTVHDHSSCSAVTVHDRSSCSAVTVYDHSSCSGVTVYDYSFKSLLPHELRLLMSHFEHPPSTKCFAYLCPCEHFFHQISLHIKYGIFMLSICPALKLALLTHDIICKTSGSILSMPHTLQSVASEHFVQLSTVHKVRHMINLQTYESK